MKLLMRCDCKDWEENIGILIDQAILAHVHEYKYEGKTFVFCPWCGCKLRKDEDE